MRLGPGTHCCPASTKANGLQCQQHDSMHKGLVPAACTMAHASRLPRVVVPTMRLSRVQAAWLRACCGHQAE